MQAKLEQWGKSSVLKSKFEVEVRRGKDGDLTDDEVWGKYEARLLDDYYDVVIESPPCNTFTTARINEEGDAAEGPSALRDATGPGRYGRPDLSIEDKEKVREGTLLSLRASNGAHICLQKSIPWLFEQPFPVEGQPHMLTLDEWKELADSVEVKQQRVFQ